MGSFKELSMSGVPLAEVVLLWQSVFNFPNWLFHECLIKNQANHNLSFVKRKMQGSEWRLQHRHTILRKVNLASFTTIFCISNICISLIVNSIFYICTYLLRFKAPMKHIERKMNRNRWKIGQLELYSNILVYTQLQK